MKISGQKARAHSGGFLNFHSIIWQDIQKYDRLQEVTENQLSPCPSKKMNQTFNKENTMTETNEKSRTKARDLEEYKWFLDDVTPVFQQEKESQNTWSVPCLL